jgi:adenine-specific DNA-methyltransferase
MADKTKDTTDYTKLKLNDLLQLCKDRGLKGCSGLKKTALIELLSSTSSTALIESDFVLQPMITYIGNKRKLVPWIMEVVEEIRAEFGHKKLSILDGFAGSGVVSRALMPFCSQLYSNDMELYSYILLRCFLETPSSEQRARINLHFDEMDRLCQNPTEVGFISKLYSPKNNMAPTAEERVFYTRENAMIIDTLIKYIFAVEEDIRPYLLGPLIIKASINVNTAGVFRGFYKKDGVGHFGGTGENALERILAPIQLVRPLWSSTTCKSICYNSDITNLILRFEDKSLDLIYLDPPYNEHPYGSNYFMLNLIARGQEPTEYSKVSGIPKMWNKSAFNGRGSAYDTMLDLLRNCLKKAKYTLISYNNEGLVTEDDWIIIFKELSCNVKKYEKEYDTYHGSRNLNSRNKKVVEIMYLISLS